MQKIAVCAYFRDSQIWHGHQIKQVDKFFNYMDQQERDSGAYFTYYLLEGDSSDNTLQTIKDEMINREGRIKLTNYSIGGRGPCSDGKTQRRKELSEVGNACLKPALQSNHDLILWMESDLKPGPSMVKGLLEATEKLDWNKTIAVAPVATITFHGKVCFYDGFAYEGINGERWMNIMDLDRLVDYPDRYRPMRSIGSAALLNAKIMREHNIDFGDGCFPLLCKKGIEKGYKVYCDKTLTVDHPGSANIGGRWC